jgi:hypothetical protein
VIDWALELLRPEVASRVEALRPRGGDPRALAQAIIAKMLGRALEDGR